MSNARVGHNLIIATLTALVSGCSTWAGPAAMVEDRRSPTVDRSRTVASKAPGAHGDLQVPGRKEEKKPRRQMAKKPDGLDPKESKEIPSPGARAGADVMSSDDQVLDMKPSRYLR